MSPAAKFLPKRTHKAAIGVINHDRLASHARLVDRVGHIDSPLFVLSESMRVTPDQTIWRHEPIVHALIGVKSRAHYRQALAGFVRCVHVESRNCGGGSECRTANKKRPSGGGLHEISSGTIFAGMTPVNFCSRP